MQHRNLRRRRHITRDPLEDRNDGNIAGHRGHKHGNKRPVVHCPLKTMLDFVVGQFLTAKIFLQQFIFALGGGFHHRHVRLLRCVFVLSRDVDDLTLRTFAAFHRQNADHAFEILLLAPRQLHRHQFDASRQCLHRLQRALEVGVLAIHLVNHYEARQFELVAVLPHQFGAHFHTGHRIHHDDGRVRHAQRRLHLAHKVGEARRVQNVDFVIVEFDRNEGSADGNLAALFLFVEV